MRQNVTSLTRRQELAARLLADDSVGDVEISKRCKISRATLDRWKNRPEFQARIEEVKAAFREAVLRKGIADRIERVQALMDRWRRMQAVIAERAVEYAAIPGGGKTGLLVRQIKQVGTGRDAERVDEYAVDTGLLRELRAHEEQAARELGQWVERRSVDSDELRAAIERELQRVGGEKSAERGLARVAGGSAESVPAGTATAPDGGTVH